jgi:hypothetical protein
LFTQLKNCKLMRRVAVTLHCKVHADKFTESPQGWVGLLGVPMNQYPDSILLLSSKPSAFIPMLMSVAALTLLLGGIAAGVVVREADEGAIAHIWQLLMAGQLPLLAYFAIRWLPRVPRQTLYVLAMQIGAALAAMAPVYFLGL